MELIKEPLDVDFFFDSTPLTKREKKIISDFIKADKEKRRATRVQTTKKHRKQNVK